LSYVDQEAIEMQKRTIVGSLVVVVVVLFLVTVMPKRRGEEIAVRPHDDESTASDSTRQGVGAPFDGAGPKRGFLPLPYIANAPTASGQNPEERSRDGYYERLLKSQGRDLGKEKELMPKLVAVFSNDPETAVGALACSREFCRVDLRGLGKVDVRKNWQPSLGVAVEPKGFKFFILERDQNDNTVASYYFGRSESWTVPDFYALGIR
jgi:hypothetical protein